MFQELVTDLLKDGYKVSFIAPGHSMYPTIMADEPVLVEPIDPAAVHKGDIVLYRTNGHLIAHRVMGIVRDDKATEYSSLLEAFSPDTDLPPNNIYHKLEKANALQDSKLWGSTERLFFILRGDASRTFDEPVKSEQVLGKVISIQRNGNSINPYCLQHKLASWFYKSSLRLKVFFGLTMTRQ